MNFTVTDHMYKTMFTVNGSDYPPVLTSPGQYADGKHFRPSSVMIFCPQCGTVWARRKVLLEPDDHVGLPWQTRSVICRPCGNGSLWDAFDESWCKSIPPVLLKREMAIVEDYHALGIRTWDQYFSKIIWRKNNVRSL